MKGFYKLATFALLVTLAAGAFAQAPSPKTTTLANLTEGQGTVVNSGNISWDGWSEVVLIPGAALLGPAPTENFLYLGFVGGTEADVGNMVLYSVARGGNAVIKATKVTLGGKSDPSIDLASSTTCPNGSPSVTNPCIVKLDALKPGLSPLDDYYFVIYFTLDTNNEHIVGAGQSNERGALSGWYLYGDQTRIGADGAVPTGNEDSPPFFLMYVMND